MLFPTAVQQAMAFALTTVYLAKDKIEVGTTTCWANGWFVSTGRMLHGQRRSTCSLPLI
jgi:hypothetical protein